MFITAGAKTKGWRGVVFTRIPIRDRSGKFTQSWVAGFCTDFAGKDQAKKFVTNRGGTWDGVQRFWYVPLQGAKVGEILESFWMIAQEGIAVLSPYMEMGGIHISVEADIPQAQKEKTIKWLEKQAKIAQLGLSLVPGKGELKTMPVVQNIKREEDEDESGRIRCIRYIGSARGSNEYLYKNPPKTDDIFDCKSGVDIDGNTWYWLEGEMLLADSFRSEGGWHQE